MTLKMDLEIVVHDNDLILGDVRKWIVNELKERGSGYDGRGRKKFILNGCNFTELNKNFTEFGFDVNRDTLVGRFEVFSFGCG